jgi:hypothetical protein
MLVVGMSSYRTAAPHTILHDPIGGAVRAGAANVN